MIFKFEAEFQKKISEHQVIHKMVLLNLITLRKVISLFVDLTC